jgi:hypothetical protein
MQGRPLSSRPSTSARPTTAFDRDQFQQQCLQQHQQPHELEEESEEESDDEDVFAFLPPTTADQESTSQSPFSFAAVQYPEPTFDPWGRQYPICPHVSPPIPPGIGIPSQTHPHPYSHNIPPPSPSTDSHPSTGMSGPDSYRLNRLGTAAFPTLGVVDDVEEMKMEPEQDGDDTKNEVSEKADEGNPVDTDKEIYPSDTSDLENASLHRQNLAAISPQAIMEAPISVLRERRPKNLNAMPYKMYSQQASSYYGRDVRTGSAAASGVGMPISLLYPSFCLT